MSDVVAASTVIVSASTVPNFRGPWSHLGSVLAPLWTLTGYSTFFCRCTAIWATFLAWHDGQVSDHGETPKISTSTTKGKKRYSWWQSGQHTLANPWWKFPTFHPHYNGDYWPIETVFFRKEIFIAKMEILVVFFAYRPVLYDSRTLRFLCF